MVVEANTGLEIFAVFVTFASDKDLLCHNIFYTTEHLSHKTGNDRRIQSMQISDTKCTILRSLEQV